MGSFIGHAAPGSMFLLLSVWWFIGALIRKHQNTKTKRGLLLSSGTTCTRLKTHTPVWYPCPGKTLSKIPLEPILKVFCAFLGVLGELALHQSWTLIGNNGEFMEDNINNHSHAAMYCFFGLSGVIDLMMWYGVISLPPMTDYVIMSVCFWIEGFLFYFHLQGHSEISVRLHTILYLVIFITAALFLADVFFTQHQSLFSLMRAVLVAVQGSWFYQIAFVLYGPNPWRNTSTNVEVLSIAFAWHLFIFIVLSVMFVAVSNRFCGKKYTQDNQLDEEISDEETEHIPLKST
ncbi:transmembrane protein 45A-like [Stylophora pistillata]|uniref:transmembrane protein 45A-like n=1 Tax=Stylophora pistillata TaxID=50429 RepID=UPI000C044776|nr:transmembrane protein 45A-like [Stylophora pistillata]XP_022802376.1 transmembrane protein 45A-like [Stylophora pistillata]